MTKVIVSRRDGAITSLVCRGHSGYAQAGKDIVCAAISAVVQTAGIGIAHINGGTIDVSVGYYCIRIERDSHDAQLILSTAILGLRDIMSGYPKNIKMEDRIV